MTAYILNLIDLAFTLYALSHGAYELNPFIRCVPVMVAYKVAMVGALLHWLSRRKEPIACNGVKLVTVAFAAVNIYHIINLF
jgi:hypothetical protein